MTRQRFYDSLSFDTTLIPLPPAIKNLDDSDVIQWVVEEVANKEDRYNHENEYNYCFFVTKDYNFKSDSNFNKHTKALNPNTRLVVIIIPATEKVHKLKKKNRSTIQNRTLNRLELLNIIIDKLNYAWKNRSPR